MSVDELCPRTRGARRFRSGYAGGLVVALLAMSACGESSKALDAAALDDLGTPSDLAASPDLATPDLGTPDLGSGPGPDLAIALGDWTLESDAFAVADAAGPSTARSLVASREIARHILLRLTAFGGQQDVPLAVLWSDGMFGPRLSDAGRRRHHPAGRR